MLEMENVKSVDASMGNGRVSIEYEGEKPSVDQLNQVFKKLNYTFSETPVETKSSLDSMDYAMIVSVSVLIISAFFLLNKLGLANALAVTTKSAPPAFFLFGIMAGLSSCAALVGGLILSISKQWNELYSSSSSTFSKMRPHFMFNIGRIVSYTVLGGLLGAIGGKLQLSAGAMSVLVFIVAIFMVILGLQMLGVKSLQKFQVTAPKFLLRYVADESNFKGKYLPFVMGALTFFLPCGFTITAQGIALISGSALVGALIMLFFALGTLPVLLLIGFSSVKFSKEPHRSYKFAKIAGILVLFFALFTINNQLNFLGLKSFSDFFSGSNTVSTDNSDTAVLVDGKQVLKMNASATGYSPNYLKVKAGVPVRWEITDTGTSGCTNAVIARGLFDGPVQLTVGETAVKEFTPTTPGTYKFSCWMGMITGTIEVTN
jgi:sulfite exporter TauE/SafE